MSVGINNNLTFSYNMNHCSTCSLHKANAQSGRYENRIVICNVVSCPWVYNPCIGLLIWRWEVSSSDGTPGILGGSLVTVENGGGTGAVGRPWFTVWVLGAESADVILTLTIVVLLVTIGAWFAHTICVLVCDLPISRECLDSFAISPMIWFCHHVILSFE